VSPRLIRSSTSRRPRGVPPQRLRSGAYRGQTTRRVRHLGEARPFGRYLEDFEVGDVYKHWPGKTITEYDDHLFCMITMNHHPLHTNAHYAETSTQFKRNVVVGNLVYSLALGMSVPDVSGKAIANLEVESLKHTAPMFHGDTLYAQTKVLDKKESTSKPDRGVVTVETRGYNQDGVEVLYFRRKVLVPKRGTVEEQPGRPEPKPSE
jgi:acyl dehydratase